MLTQRMALKLAEKHEMSIHGNKVEGDRAKFLALLQEVYAVGRDSEVIKTQYKKGDVKCG